MTPTQARPTAKKVRERIEYSNPRRDYVVYLLARVDQLSGEVARLEDAGSERLYEDFIGSLHRADRAYRNGDGHSCDKAIELCIRQLGLLKTRLRAVADQPPLAS